MSDWPETSESLILRVKDPQDMTAWRELVAVYRPVLRKCSALSRLVERLVGTATVS